MKKPTYLRIAVKDTVDGVQKWYAYDAVWDLIYHKYCLVPYTVIHDRYNSSLVDVYDSKEEVHLDHVLKGIPVYFLDRNLAFFKNFTEQQSRKGPPADLEDDKAKTTWWIFDSCSYFCTFSQLQRHLKKHF